MLINDNLDEMKKFLERQTIKVHLKIDCLNSLIAIQDFDTVQKKPNLPTHTYTQTAVCRPR